MVVFFIALVTVIVPATILVSLIIFAVHDAVESRHSRLSRSNCPAGKRPAAVGGADRRFPKE
jgi:uncharacterized membrane protein